jgi:hypothetical protein
MTPLEELRRVLVASNSHELRGQNGRSAPLRTGGLVVITESLACRLVASLEAADVDESRTRTTDA